MNYTTFTIQKQTVNLWQCLISERDAISEDDHWNWKLFKRNNKGTLGEPRGSEGAVLKNLLKLHSTLGFLRGGSSSRGTSTTSSSWAWASNSSLETTMRVPGSKDSRRVASCHLAWEERMEGSSSIWARSCAASCSSSSPVGWVLGWTSALYHTASGWKSFMCDLQPSTA